MKTNENFFDLSPLNSTYQFPSTDNIAYSENEVSAARSVWKSVIGQALLDASCQSKQAKKIRAKIRALQWLREKSTDFDMVCELAGWNPSVIRKKINIALRNGCKWRQDNRSYENLIDELGLEEAAYNFNVILI
jgi:hypothetical protein